MHDLSMYVREREGGERGREREGEREGGRE